MYLSMLKNAVNDIKGHQQEPILDTELFNDRALIPLIRISQLPMKD